MYFVKNVLYLFELFDHVPAEGVAVLEHPAEELLHAHPVGARVACHLEIFRSDLDWNLEAVAD